MLNQLKSPTFECDISYLFIYYIISLFLAIVLIASFFFNRSANQELCLHETSFRACAVRGWELMRSRISHCICFARMRTWFVIIFINQPARKDLAWPGCHDNNRWLAIFNLSLNKIIFLFVGQTWKYHWRGFYNRSYLLYIVIWGACYTRIIP